MHFKFDVNVTENDYIEFNEFVLVKSPHLKRIMLLLRILFAVLFIWLIVIALSDIGFNLIGILAGGLFLAMGVIVQIFLGPIYMFFFRSSIKSIRRSGKLPYEEKSDMEFYDEHLLACSPSSKVEQKYSSIEKIVVVDGRVIYLFISSAQAYLLPARTFDGREQFENFTAFIKERCSNAAFNRYRYK